MNSLSIGNWGKYLLLMTTAFLPASCNAQEDIDLQPQVVSEPSHTLPVIYIDTQDGQAITSKKEYLSATFYIVDPTRQVNVGSKATPRNMQIRGRGHSSWKSDKKPYKVKLEEKLPLLGMPEHKHWTLLKFYPPTIVGMKLGNLMGMDWTPSTKPIEVVLNGNYIGLYLLTESIRISQNRVDIYEQPDNNEDPNTIPYGWIVEVDNYFERNQIVFRENPKWNINITYHAPKVLSEAQKDWLLQEFKGINQAIYAEDKEHSTWEQRMDAGAMARFFIIQEVLDNPDGFHGSFYLHKDLGEGEKWVAGPIWDLTCMKRDKTDYTYNMKVSYGFTPHWIDELLKDNDFCLAVRKAWKAFYPDKAIEWLNEMNECLKPYEDAYQQDRKRWSRPPYVPLSDEAVALQLALNRNIEWFNHHLPGKEPEAIPSTQHDDEHYTVYTLQGRKVREAHSYAQAIRGLSTGLYIINGKKTYVP